MNEAAGLTLGPEGYFLRGAARVVPVGVNSYHCYPVPHWTGLRFDGITDRYAQALMPHGVSSIRVHGPVMVQEFGTLITGAAAPQDAYLRAVLPAAWKAGANGFLWWCLKDIRSRAFNYVRSSMEGTLGLVDEAGRVKPGLQSFIDFARDVQTMPAPDLRHPVALYWPKHFYSRENPSNVGNDARSVHNRKLSAFHALALRGVDCCHFEHWHTPEECRLELAQDGAVPVAVDDTGFPMLWQHDLGAGRVVFCLASVEEAMLNSLMEPAARDRWARWYAGALALLEGPNEP